MVIPKPIIEWTKEESKESKWNKKGLYAIIIAITPNENRIIQSCTTCK